MRKATQLIQLAKRSAEDITSLEEDKRQLRHLLDAYEWVRRTIDTAA